MIYVTFILSSLVVVFAAIKLAQYGDIIAVRTQLGGLFVGTILLAGATSLPELIASISSFRQGVPDLAAGNLFGSNMVNMLLLAIVDLVYHRIPLLRRNAVTQALTAVLATTLMLLAVIFEIANLDYAIGWVGVDSIVLIVIYFGGIWLIQHEGKLSQPSGISIQDQPGDEFPSLRRGVVGFILASGLLLVVIPRLVESTAAIAEITGLGNSFVGTALLSVITSLPELLAAITAVRMGSIDLAVGNLFGSSVFNMLSVGIVDFFYTEGRFLGAIDSSFVLVGVIGILLTNLALLGNLARVERRFLFIEIDALVIILVYLGGLYLLYVQGTV